MRRSMKIRGFGKALTLLALFTLSVTGVVWSQTVAAASAVSAKPSNGVSAPARGSVTISVGDSVKVTVLGSGDADQQVRVDQDGNATLNFIGAVHLGGLTTSEAQTLIAKKLNDGGFFNKPEVAVSAVEFGSQNISVLGEVQKPGVYQLVGSRRLFDVLSMAGGTTQKAGRIVSITHRENPEAPRSVLLSNDAGQSAQSNIEVYAGDTILVSRAGVVYVVGDVHKPSGVTMDNGTDMTVLQAIAMAEGTNSTAALNKAKLIRKTPNGPQELPLALKDMLASKAPDVRLQAEDIIFVPNSVAKSATKRTLEAIIQSATGLAVYGARP